MRLLICVSDRSNVMAHDNHHHDSAGANHGTTKSYVTGFILSIILTAIPFYMVMHPGYSHAAIIASIVGIAVIQILVHLYYFLHMNSTSEQRWNTVSFAFTVMVLALLVG